MVASCLVGCGDTTTSTSKETKEVTKSEKSNKYGTLLVEAEHMKAYAKEDTLIFELEEGEDERWMVAATLYDENDVNNTNIEEGENGWYAEADEENPSLYQLTLEEKGDYLCQIIHHYYDKEKDMYMGDGSYNLYFTFDEEINMDTITATDAFSEDLPALAYHGAQKNESITNAYNVNSNEDDIADFDNEMKEVSITIENETFSIPFTYEDLKNSLEGYDVSIYDTYEDIRTSEIDENKEYSTFYLDYMKNGATFLELAEWGGVLKDMTFYDVTLFNVEGVTFSVNAGDNYTITNSTTKSEIKEMSNEFNVSEDGNVMYISLPYDYNYRIFKITLDGENIKELSIQ